MGGRSEILTGLRKDDRLSDWMRRVDDLPVDDAGLRGFAYLLGVSRSRGLEDREGIASMTSIVAAPESDADDVQAALATLRESLHSTVLSPVLPRGVPRPAAAAREKVS